MSVDVGAKAPDFTLHNQDRENVTLSEELKKGPVVLAFFPAAFSGTCQKELCTFRDSATDLNKVGAQVLGVSTDTFFALKAWGDAQKLALVRAASRPPHHYLIPFTDNLPILDRVLNVGEGGAY